MTDRPATLEGSRRRVLDLMLRIGALSWLASVLYPVFRYLTPLPLQGPAGPVQLSADELSKLERDRFTIVPVGRTRVLVFEDPAGDLRALSAKCTHEGCLVRYQPTEAIIFCACHNGRYDLNGRVLSGPPPRPLAHYQVVREAGDRVSVTV